MLCLVVATSLSATSLDDSTSYADSGSNDISIGFLSFLTFANQTNDKSITFLNFQYSRKITPPIHLYFELYLMKGEIAYTDPLKNRLIDKFGVIVLQTGIYYYPFSNTPVVKNLWLKSGIGISNVDLESGELESHKLRRCFFIGPGYRAVFADFFILNIGITFNPFPVHITNTLENRQQGATQGYGLEWFYPDLSFGFRF